MRNEACDPIRLARLLERESVSPERLSRQTDIALGTIRRYLHGTRESISTRNMLAIARYLDIPMQELVDYLAGVDALHKDEE